eukprot:GDKI01042127.1.p2 GENE.GDKI01042127.1~~GDKI01042127.1.p2  ORF type:complete len:110 (-),score=17.45 GDKI01042127.1:32-361(-)
MKGDTETETPSPSQPFPAAVPFEESAAKRQPMYSIRSRWTCDPLFMGSYSYPTVCTQMNDAHDLGETVANKLFFAGEATSARHYGSLLGAFQSGSREADKVAEMLAHRS